MGSKKKNWFINQGGANLFIGGVSATINTPALLVAKFNGVLESEVEDFTIDGTDISAKITNTTYNVLNSAFLNDLTITSIRETSGYLTSLSGSIFLGATNLVLVDLIGCNELITSTFYNCTNLQANNIVLPNLEVISGSSVFRNIHSSLGQTLDFPKLITMDGAYNFLNFQGTFDVPILETVIGNTECFYGFNGILNAPILKYIGSTVLNNEVFRGSSGAILNVDSYCKTSNSGGIEGDLVDATTVRSAIVLYSGDVTNPIIDLATVNVYATILDINWSAPIGGNPIKEYNIYVDDIYHSTTIDLFKRINVLTYLQTYKIVVKAVDYLNAESTDSNILNVLMNGNDYPLANIISEYKFENNVLDTVGTNNGTATAITYASGLVGQTGVFNGSTSKVVVADNDNLSFTNGLNDLPFSWSFIVNLDTVVGNSFIIAKRNTLSEYQLGFIGNELRFRLFGNSGVAETLQWEHSGFLALTNYHIVITYDGSETATTTSLKLYVNGIQVTITTPPNEIGTYSGMVNTSEVFEIGVVTGLNYLDGTLDCVRVWDKELSQSEVTNIATQELDGIDINP